MWTKTPFSKLNTIYINLAKIQLSSSIAQGTLQSVSLSVCPVCLCCVATLAGASSATKECALNFSFAGSLSHSLFLSCSRPATSLWLRLTPRPTPFDYELLAQAVRLKVAPCLLGLKATAGGRGNWGISRWGAGRWKRRYATWLCCAARRNFILAPIIWHGPLRGRRAEDTEWKRERAAGRTMKGQLTSLYDA